MMKYVARFALLLLASGLWMSATYVSPASASSPDSERGDAQATGKPFDREPGLLTTNPNPSTDIRIHLEANKAVLEPGEELTLTARADRDCYLTIMHVGANGEVTVLWPNRANGWDEKVQANTAVHVPGAASGIRIQFDGTQQTERILAYATTEKHAIFGVQDFRDRHKDGLKVYVGNPSDLDRRFRSRVDRMPASSLWGTASLSISVASRVDRATRPGTVRVLLEVRAPKDGSAKSLFQSVEDTVSPEFRVDRQYKPVPMKPADDLLTKSLAQSREEVMLIRGEVDERFFGQLESQPNVIKAWRDTPLSFDSGRCPMPQCDCDVDVPRGSIPEVARYLGVEKIWAEGYRGKGVVIGIVDTGITAKGRYNGPLRKIPRVMAGWPGNWGTITGKHQHGNMTATDALGMAPEAALLDMRISGPTFKAWASNAIAAYQWAINLHQLTGAPHILSNSWGLYDKSIDPDFAENPKNPTARKILDALDEGILVVFSAGNCGEGCPNLKIGCGSVGPGKSIWGPKGGPRVMAIGAVTMNEEWIGYSSQGPAAFGGHKPDFCGISHFKGYGNCDNGTSAACPIVAGVLALLKGARPWLSQPAAMGLLARTAKDIGPKGWDQHSGAGIVQPYKAFQEVIQKKSLGFPSIGEHWREPVPAQSGAALPRWPKNAVR